MTIEQTYPGVRVLDLATNIAGPFAAMIFGDMGADVIKVERSPHGDDTRSLPPFVDGQATVFAAVNRNKRSILLDLKSPEGRETLMELVETADIVIESFPPGFADKHDFIFDDFRTRNPRILLCSISAFGDGPIGRHMPGYDALVQAVSGLMSFTGSEGDPTVRIAPSALDLGTGMWAAIALMAALTRRGVHGMGEHIKPALIDTAFTLMNHQYLAYLATGDLPRKLGSGAPSAAPYGVYAADDGELMIATASEAQFPRLCAALGLDKVATHPDFATMPARLAHRNALDMLIAAKIGTQTVEHWLTVLIDAGISAGRVNSLHDAEKLPVVRERDYLMIPADKEDSEAIPQLRLPIDPGRTAFRRQPPQLGEHIAEIMKELRTVR